MEWVYNQYSPYNDQKRIELSNDNFMKPNLRRSLIPVRRSVSKGLSSPVITRKEGGDTVSHNNRRESENIYEEPGSTFSPRLTSSNINPAYRNVTANNILQSPRLYTANGVERKPAQLTYSKHPLQNETRSKTNDMSNNCYEGCYVKGQVIINNIQSNKRSNIPTLNIPSCNTRTSQHSVERIQSRPLPIPQANRSNDMQQPYRTPNRSQNSYIHGRGKQNSPSLCAPVSEVKSMTQRQHSLNGSIRRCSKRKEISIRNQFSQEVNCDQYPLHKESSNIIEPFHKDDCSDETLVSNTKEKNMRKGYMWCLHDKIFARWKERFVIITQNSLKIFKKTISQNYDSENLLFDIPLSSVKSMALEDRRGYLTIAIYCQEKHHGKIVLRRTDGIREWFSVLQNIQKRCKDKLESEGSMLSTEEFWNKKHFSDLGCEPLRASWRKPPPSPWEHDSGRGSLTTTAHSETSSLSSHQFRAASPLLYSPQRHLRMVIK